MGVALPSYMYTTYVWYTYKKLIKKYYAFQILILAGMAVLASAAEMQQEAADSHEPRDNRNPVNIFPFNSQSHHHPHQNQTSARDDRQDSILLALPNLSEQEHPDLSTAAIAAAEERCSDKVVMETHIVYDDIVTCKHSYR